MSYVVADGSLEATSQKRLRKHWFVAPVLAAVYPLTLSGFTQAANAAKVSGSLAQGLFAAVFLALSVTVPIVSMWVFGRLLKSSTPTRAEMWARRTALFAVASPPLFVFTGVMTFVAGAPSLDVWILAVFWLALCIAIMTADRRQPVPLPREAVNGNLRVSHGVVALVFIVAFLSLHLANHLSALVSVPTHAAIMDVLRQYYRSAIVEPILFCAVAFLVVSGGVLAWKWSARPGDAFRAFQVGSGVFLAVAIFSHMQAVFWFARIHMKIPTDWGFAIGAPTGIVFDPWNIRLLPYYFLAVVFAIGHPFAGLRIVMLQHGGDRKVAAWLVVGGTVLGLLIATLISLAMGGLRVNFSGT